MCDNLACYENGCISAAPNGAEGQLLTIQGGAVVWADPDGSNATPVCDQLAVLGASGALVPATIGNEGQVLTGTSRHPVWAGSAQPSVPLGGYLVGVTNDCVASCDEGEPGERLVMVSGFPVWTNTTVDAVILLSETEICTGESIAVTDQSIIDNCYGTPAYSHESSDDGGATWVEYATTADATFVPATPGTYMIRLTVSCDSVSSTSAVQTVNVAQVSITAAANQSSIVEDNEIILTSTPVVENCTGAAVEYEWSVSIDGGAPTVFAVTQNTTHTPADPGSYVYSVTISCPDHGCTDTDTVTVMVNPDVVIIANASIDTADQLACTGETVAVTDNSTIQNCSEAATYSHESSDDNGATWTEYATTADATFVPATPGTYMIRLTVSCGGAENTSNPITIQVAEVTATMTVDSATINDGESVNVTDTSTITNCTGAAATYSHEFSSNGGVSWTQYATTQNAVFTPAAPGNYLLRMTVTCPDHGCTDTTATQAITVNAVIVNAAFTPSDTTTCTDDPVTLTNNSTATNCTLSTQSWAVSVNGGAATQFSTAASPTYTPTVPGSHVITLTQNCDGGATDTATQTIQVAEVTATMTVSATAINNGQSVNVTDTSTITNCTGAAATYAHQFSDDGGATWSTYATTQNAVFTPAAPGNYLLRMTVACPDHGCTDTTATQAITVSAISVNAAFTPSDTTICTDDPVTLTNNSTANNCTLSTQSWTVSIDGGAATQFSTALSPTYTPTAPGSHVITLTQNCDGGATDTATQTIEVAEVTATMTVDSATIDEGESVNVTDTSTITNCTGAAATYVHQFSDDNGATWSTYATTQNAVFTPAAPGNYLLRMTVTCPTHGCTDTTATQAITVNAVAAALPCVDAVCYVSRVSADNAASTRLFADPGTTDQGFSATTIKTAGGQDFVVDGHPTATFNLVGVGNTRSTFPQVNSAGTASARQRTRNLDSQAGAFVLTYTFSEPVCGVISVNLDDLATATNPVAILTANVPLDSGPRADLSPAPVYAGDGTTQITMTGGNGLPAYGLVYFNNLTTLDISIENGELLYGMYFSDSCDVDAVETQIVHCPTDNEFYVFDANVGDWVLDTSITALGEWMPVDCPA